MVRDVEPNIAMQDELAKQHEFSQAVRRACGITTRPVDSSHRIVGAETPLLRELYSNRLGERVIAMPQDSRQALTHVKLFEKRIPVFSAFSNEGVLILWVPEGAKPMSRIMPAIAREPEKYVDLFAETGRVLRRMMDAELGMPAVDEDRYLFDHLAFATDAESSRGASIYLVPPYEFDPSLSQEDVIDYVGAELESFGFEPAVIDRLAEAVDGGWNEDAQ